MITSSRKSCASSIDPGVLREKIELAAAENGFAMCKIAPAIRAPHAESFRSWLESGAHAEMDWMERTAEKRTDARNVLPGARSIVLLATNYYQGPDSPPAPELACGTVARYARGRDYHNLLRKKVRRVAQVLELHGHAQRCYTDTGPVLERDYAALAGIGWQGKSTMLLNETLGTWFLLSTIVTTADLPHDAPVKHRCGSCTRCIAACPTGAITAPYHLDARRCISYWTIEHRGRIPDNMREAIGSRLFGCDDCLTACPWNRFAKRSHELQFSPSPGIADIPLRTLLDLDNRHLTALLEGTPLARTGCRGLKRNACIVLGNIGGKEDVPALRRIAGSDDALLADHASWALRRLATAA